jgi:hypothetical protein
MLSSTVSTAAASATAASTAERLDLESLSQDGLNSEIAMLRIVTRRVFDLSTGVEDLETISRLLALLSLASGRIAAMQRVQVLVASNRPDELKTIFSEAIDEAFHEMRNPKASAL